MHTYIHTYMYIVNWCKMIPNLHIKLDVFIFNYVSTLYLGIKLCLLDVQMVINSVAVLDQHSALNDGYCE